MSHTFTSKDGYIFHYNADGSGDVMIIPCSGNMDFNSERAVIPMKDILQFTMGFRLAKLVENLEDAMRKEL